MILHDDGQGLADDVHAGLGLASMRERAAELGGTRTFEARLGAGTRLMAVLPLDALRPLGTRRGTPEWPLG